MGERDDRVPKGIDSEAKDQDEHVTIPPSVTVLVRRTQLLTDLASKGRKAGVSVLCAPKGFGKTALLMQYIAEVRSDPSRGVAQLIDADDVIEVELERRLVACAEELSPKMHPLIAIDDVPDYSDEDMKRLLAKVRSLRKRGYEFVISCGPLHSKLITAMGDSFRLGAQMLRVQAREYSDWARKLSISHTLDVYDLTQGVPALVSLLPAVTSGKQGTEALELGAARLYRETLESIRPTRDPIYRVMCFFVLVGHGMIADFERCGLRIREEYLTRVARDFPIFGLDAEKRSFRCMGGNGEAMWRLRHEISRHRSAYALKAARILMRAGRVDDTVRLAGRLLEPAETIELISQFPIQFALSGNAGFVCGMMTRLDGEQGATLPMSAALAVYLAALEIGDYRMARTVCAELRRNAKQLESEVSVEDWEIACAMVQLWRDCSGVELPQLSERYGKERTVGDGCLLRTHRALYDQLIGGDGVIDPLRFPEMHGRVCEDAVDWPFLLLECDRMLSEALHGDVGDAAAVDGKLQEIAQSLNDRHLTTMAVRVRMVAATCRLMSGLPIVDERAFTDAGTIAVRESDFTTQLFCLLGEGWQSIALGQVVNARFRAQQVLKLADQDQSFLRDWGLLLERVAYILNSSRMKLRETAELLDLTQKQCVPAEAWSVALHLAAARFDSELSAWFSLHKAEMLDARFYPMARLAIATIGERAEAARRLIPLRLLSKYTLGDEPAERKEPLFSVVSSTDFAELGQVNIGLFGGFRAERNGHTLTDEAWRRKRATVLAARLVLALGSFVSRRVITEEMWPNVEYARARENLYVALSALRRAFRQQQSGPQYVLTQGDGIAINSEFVSADTGRFDMLARDILLKRAGVSGKQIIDMCLSMEELYTGPLYVPDTGDVVFFQRMRRAYASKFIDCMLRGIDVALEMDDLSSASWLVGASLRHAPLREDVIRCAMVVYDRSGRRREVVELYNSHLHHLKHELNSVPEEETRQLYERIINDSENSAFL